MTRPRIAIYWRPDPLAVAIVLAFDLVLVGLAVAAYRLMGML